MSIETHLGIKFHIFIVIRHVIEGDRDTRN